MNSSKMESSINANSTNYDNIHIIKVRGKNVISTFPIVDMTFGSPNAILECAECMANGIGSYKGVLYRLCKKCNLYHSRKYDTTTELSHPFGFEDKPYNILEIEKRISLFVQKYNEQKFIKNEDAYSFYGIASLSDKEFKLLFRSKFGYSILAERYNIEDRMYETRRFNYIYKILTQLHQEYKMINLLFNEFSPQSSKFFEKCEKLEKDCSIYKIDINKKENKQMHEREQNINEVKPCTYCGIKNKIRNMSLCGGCKSVYYCSVACQRRDWRSGDGYVFDLGPRSPHKEFCEYLNNIRVKQENYLNNLRRGEIYDEYMTNIL